MLNKKLQKIFDEYKRGDNWLPGNFIPPEERKKYKIMFIGAKPSDYFIKRPHLRYLGNYNATFIDMGLQCFLNKHKLGKIYITDMVKTQGKAGEDFEKEWNSDDSFKKCLEEEIRCYKPKIIVLMGEKVKELFNESFEGLVRKLNIQTALIYHPSYLGRSPHQTEEWDNQFKEIKKKYPRILKKVGRAPRQY